MRTKRETRLWIVAVLVLVLSLAGCGAKPGANEKSSQPAAQVKEIKPGEALKIPISELAGTARFYTIRVDGTVMEILAVKTPDGKARTAFNTCQTCNGSPYAYFEQRGNLVECQNCGNQFPMSSVETETSGCNPWSIFAKDKTVTEDTISISYAFLSANKHLFKNWKAGI